MKAPVPYSTHSKNAAALLRSGQGQYADGRPTFRGRPLLIDDSLPSDGIFEGPHPQFLRRLVSGALYAAINLLGIDLSKPADEAQIAKWNEQLRPMVKALYPLSFFELQATNTENGVGLGFGYSMQWELPSPRRIDAPTSGDPTVIYEDGV